MMYRLLGMSACSAMLLVPPLITAHIDEDGYISLRMAENLALGYGYSFDRVERESAASNPLWVLTVAAATAIIPPLHSALFAAKFLEGLLLVGLGGGITLLTTRADDPPYLKLLVPFLVGLLITVSDFMYWSFSGLENALLSFLLVGAAVCIKHRWLRCGILIATAVSLTRLEGAAYTAVIVAVLAWQVRPSLDRVWFFKTIQFGSIPLITWIGAIAWHHFYFGLPLPNSYYLKGTMPLSDIPAGIKYAIWAFFELPTIFAWFVLAYAGSIIGKKSHFTPPTACCLGFLGCATLVAVRAGGDYMIHYRLFSWILPLLGAVSVRGIIDLALGEAPAVTAKMLPAVLSTLIVATAATGYKDVRNMQAERAGRGGGELVDRMVLGEQIDNLMQGRRYRLGTSRIGSLGYGAKNAQIIDPLLLASREAIPEASFDPNAIPGHRMSNVDFVTKSNPDILSLTIRFSTLEPDQYLAELRATESKPMSNSDRGLLRLAMSESYELTWIDVNGRRGYFFRRKSSE